MTDKEKEEAKELISSIVETTKDYKNGKVMSEEHVNKWIEQFNKSSRLTILREMDHILKKQYVSRIGAATFMETILKDERIVGDFKKNFSALSFMKIQLKGESQNDLLELLDEVMQEKFDISLSECGSQPTTYIYVDDCLFSGNTLLRDIESWAKKNQIQNTTLHFVFLALFDGNIKYLNQKLMTLFKDKNVTFKFWRAFEFSNKPWEKKDFQCLWPSEPDDNDKHVKSFREFIEERRKEKEGQDQYPLFRPAGHFTKESLFSSAEAREVVEQEFLKHGSYLYTFAGNPSFKPMGYSYFLSLGFGSLFVTYRNVANNSPLVLWWGDSTQKHLNQWHPLFPRRVNW